MEVLRDWERDYIPNASLSPPEWLLHWDGQRWEPFNVSLIVRDRVTRQCPQTTFPKRRESRSGFKPRSFCIPTVPLSRTGSQIKCGSNRSRPYAPPSRPMGKLLECHYCENSLPKKSEKKITTKETPHYNIAKLNQPRFMAQVKAVVNWRHNNGNRCLRPVVDWLVQDIKQQNVTNVWGLWCTGFDQEVCRRCLFAHTKYFECRSCSPTWRQYPWHCLSAFLLAQVSQWL